MKSRLHVAEFQGSQTPLNSNSLLADPPGVPMWIGKIRNPRATRQGMRQERQNGTV
jgi:hypothetical protein